MDRIHGRLILLQSLLALANAMATVFAMVFLLKRANFPLEYVVVLDVLTFAFATVGCVALARRRRWRGYALIAAGLGILLVSYVSFFVLRGWPLVIVVALGWGVYIPLFWLPFNALAVGITRDENRAGKLGTFSLAYTVVAIVAPSIGGYLIDVAGYEALFATAAGVLACEIAIVLLLRRQLGEPVFAIDLRGVGGRTGVGLFAEGAFEGLSFGAIPLIAYHFTTAELSLGGLFSLFALAGGVVTITLGIVSDRLRNRRPFLLVGALVPAVAAILVVRASSLSDFAVGNSLLTLTASVAPLFLYAIAAERFPQDAGRAVATREVLLNAGRAASLAAFLALTALGVGLQLAFGLAAVSLLFIALADPAPSRNRREA